MPRKAQVLALMAIIANNRAAGQVCPKSTSLERRTLEFIAATTFDAEIESVPLEGGDGLTWVIDGVGHLHKTDKTLNQVTPASTSSSYDGTVQAAVLKRGKVGSKETVIATSTGSYYCYDSSGRLTKQGQASGEPDSFTFSAPINTDKAYFLSDSGVPFSISANCSSLKPLFDQNLTPGNTTSHIAQFRAQKTLVYATERLNGEGVMTFQVNLVSLDGRTTSIPIKEKIISNPLITTINDTETALLLGEDGHVHGVNNRGVGRPQPPIDLDCKPTTKSQTIAARSPLTEISKNLYHLFCVSKEGPTSLFFSADGTKYPQPLRDSAGRTLSALPSSPPEIIEKPRPYAVMGFSDSYVRAIDLLTGTEIAKYKVDYPIRVKPVRLEDGNYLIVEEKDPQKITESEINGKPKATLLKFGKAVPQQPIVANSIVPCIQNFGEDAQHTKPSSL